MMLSKNPSEHFGQPNINISIVSTSKWVMISQCSRLARWSRNALRFGVSHFEREMMIQAVGQRTGGVRDIVEIKPREKTWEDFISEGRWKQ